MKVAAFLVSTVAGTLAVLLGTYGVGQLAPGSPAPALLTGLGLVVVIGALAWSGFRRALSAQGVKRHDPCGLFWTPEARKLVGNKFAFMGAILGAGLAVSVIAFALTGATDPAPEALESLSFHVQMMFVVAGLTAIIVTFALNNVLRDAADVNPGQMNRINQAVLRGQDVELTDEQRLGAARMAVLVPVVLPLQKFGLFYLYSYFATAFIGTLMAGEGRLMPIVLLVFMGVVVVIYIPYLARQVRQASHYARADAALPTG
ncbi:hypothetical protein [Arthrobacter rhombi]|uniref:DUF3169 family protein n=1 Tax=Arthrobacter rhombi TaxID=71253 RepID=A0A1R4FY73_9MICC|nr:hypothetical protein [Arthrobacter rhombi]SJM60855.1 hypothetical protein FM101_06520 [Arthrobacter rhombi]